MQKPTHRKIHSFIIPTLAVGVYTARCRVFCFLFTGTDYRQPTTQCGLPTQCGLLPNSVPLRLAVLKQYLSTTETCISVIPFSALYILCIFCVIFSIPTEDFSTEDLVLMCMCILCNFVLYRVHVFYLVPKHSLVD